MHVRAAEAVVRYLDRAISKPQMRGAKNNFANMWASCKADASRERK